MKTNQDSGTWSIKRIGPKEAQYYLCLNQTNRKIDPTTVERYAKDMLAGKFNGISGESIKISKGLRLLDGQQRLTAIIKSGCTVDLEFRENLPEEIISVIDTGRKRTIKNVFEFENIKYANEKAAMIASANKLSFLILNPGKSFPSTAVLTPANALEIQSKNEDFLNESCRIIDSFYRKSDLSIEKSTIGGLYWIFSMTNKEKAIVFFENLVTGIGLLKNDPIYEMRRILIKDASQQKKMNATHKKALIIKAWNHFLKNDFVKRISFDLVREDFPKPINYAKPF